MNMFLLASYLLDRRPQLNRQVIFPKISILVAAYNEEDNIVETIESISNQDYPNDIEIIVIDDGSSDQTVPLLRNLPLKNLLVLTPEHQGKAGALNFGLQHASHDIILTVDADTYLKRNAFRELVGRLLSDPPNTAAVAGSVYVRNTRDNLLTHIQTWDYFQAIATIKRMQSLFQGTLVAQGAFSIYWKKYVLEVGGWRHCVGEDIVLTWGLLQKGYRVGFAENAISFTRVPIRYKNFFYQRSRWARGMIEAFRQHPYVLWQKKLITMLFFWNLLFPLIDMTYLLVFIPGVIAAFFGCFLIAGPITLAVLPLTLTQNLIFFFGQKKMFKEHGLQVRRDWLGFFLYILFYQFMSLPSSVHGYFMEFFNLKKHWLTKS